MDVVIVRRKMAVAAAGPVLTFNPKENE
ncbi:unnamed protein product [Acanthoscelides obtectus]|uniref:Uncharacterized protein n=1 Tax=Acanthoscelides obtectus TaxID=200917 RepID=A0A9P0M8N8_ACAOB|nr:unnamed protein product [Acanthoscelides obtectus]